MARFSDEEREAFILAASAALASKERMELTREQASALPPGETTAPDPSARRAATAPAAALMEALGRIMGAHPEVAGVRFRGHLFLLLTAGGAKMAAAVPESAIADLEG